MLKTKSSDVNPKELAVKSGQNLFDFIFGLNNAFHWYELSGNVKYQINWADNKIEGFARGDLIMDHYLGLVEKYKWEGMDLVIHAEFTWDDEK